VRTYLKRDVVESNQSDYLKITQLLQLLAGQAGNRLMKGLIKDSILKIIFLSDSGSYKDRIKLNTGGQAMEMKLIS
jgi:hypothetical protein